MYNNHKTLAIIPARSGSKRLPNKNMQKIMGVSLIGWAGNCLSKLPWIDKKVISTDSDAYGREGKRYGLEFLKRPEALSQGEHRSIIPTLIHALQTFNMPYDIILVIEPTSPLRKPEDIEGVVELFCNIPQAEAVLTMSGLPKRYHPERLTETDVADRLTFTATEPYKEQLYHWNGICYAYKPDALFEQRTILPRFSYIYHIDRPVVNIDDKDDLEFARFLMERQIYGG